MFFITGGSYKRRKKSNIKKHPIFTGQNSAPALNFGQMFNESQNNNIDITELVRDLYRRNITGGFFLQFMGQQKAKSTNW